jgi:hypothetical protein
MKAQEAKNKKKMIAYGVIIAVCALMVILDNTLLAPQSSHAVVSAPTTSTPTTSPSPSPPTLAFQAPVQPTATVKSARMLVTDRLKAYATDQSPSFPTVDAFAPPLDWLPKPAEPIVEAEESSPTPRRDKPHNLTLNAVMLDPQDSVVAINNKPLRIGQSIEGYTLIAIGEKEVTLTSGGLLVTLHLETPDRTQP